MLRSPSDTLSLTLPSQTKARTRWKRPRKPTGQEAFYLFFTVWCVVFAVVDLLADWPLNGVYSAAGAGIYWRMYQRERRGVRPNLFGPFAWTWVALVIPLIIFGG